MLIRSKRLWLGVHHLDIEVDLVSRSRNLFGCLQSLLTQYLFAIYFVSLQTSMAASVSSH